MVFANREQAALRLVPKLEIYRGQHPLVLAIPRGAVPMGEIVVNSIGGELDLLLVTKVTSDDRPELALGAVSETGLVHWEDHAFHSGFDRDQLDQLARAAVVSLVRRRSDYAPLVRQSSVEGRVVIIVDDGIATGATISVAIEAVRARNPKRLLVATPVASSQAVQKLQSLVDELIVLHVPKNFLAVSQFYDHFDQVSDGDVTRILNESRKKRPMQEAFSRGHLGSSELSEGPT